jgi:hypothetical protein
MRRSIVFKHRRPRLAGLDDHSCCTHGNSSASTRWRGMHAGSKRAREAGRAHGCRAAGSSARLSFYARRSVQVRSCVSVAVLFKLFLIKSCKLLIERQISKCHAPWASLEPCQTVSKTIPCCDYPGSQYRNRTRGKPWASTPYRWGSHVIGLCQAKKIIPATQPLRAFVAYRCWHWAMCDGRGRRRCAVQRCLCS